MQALILHGTASHVAPTTTCLSRCVKITSGFSGKNTKGD
jgi:hypothetical protein